MVIAYLRISTGKQHIANQQDEIMRFALSKDLEIHKWVTEVVSGKKAKKERKLGKTLRRLKQGDILIVTVATESYTDCFHVYRRRMSRT